MITAPISKCVFDNLIAIASEICNPINIAKVILKIKSAVKERWAEDNTSPARREG
jgi:hypothetical protein